MTNGGFLLQASVSTCL